MSAKPHITPLTQVQLRNKTALIRTDLNVPLKDGTITSDARLRAALPSIEYVLQQGGGAIVCSHLGRPSEGQPDPALSLQPIAQALQQLLGTPVALVNNWQAHPPRVTPGQVVLLENIRFCTGESDNAEPLARALAALCDVFVMDAFASAHRAHASTCGAAYHAAVACSGILLQAELDALTRSLNTSGKNPVTAVVGGAKVSTKLEVLLSLAEKVSHLVPGGGIANTFLLANGIEVGRSLCEPSLTTPARHIMQRTSVPLPTDVVVGTNPNSEGVRICAVNDVQKDEAIYDIGPETRKIYSQIIQTSPTIIWNGPLGLFEQPQYAQGTEHLAKAIASAQGYSLAGGGDTIAAIDTFGVRKGISYISTGGGAFLEYLEGRDLPGIKALLRNKPLASMLNEPPPSA